jgi:hypothetical protein
VSSAPNTAVCCDMHNRHCEPPADLCCRDCTEAAHDTFPIRHADGTPCVMDRVDPNVEQVAAILAGAEARRSAHPRLDYPDRLRALATRSVPDQPSGTR